MAVNKVGKQTLVFKNPPVIADGATIVGPKEGQGPIGRHFDKVLDDDMWGEDSWEKAESHMYDSTVRMVLEKCKLSVDQIDVMLGGDLLNQLIASNYAARELAIPFLGLYGACSTMSESLGLGSILLDGGYATHVVASCSSHFSTAERQYRNPLGLGNQRPLSAQWTVTGCGATVLTNQGVGPKITHFTIGRVMDYGVTDATNMGAAMAPAAADTIATHLYDTQRSPSDYDLIVTGDLGLIGRQLAIDLLKKSGQDVSRVFNDCGCMIFAEDQDTHSGGSGCGCSAVVFNAYLLNMLRTGEYKRILLTATGALMSPTSSLQGESIPAIAHAIAIEWGGQPTEGA